MSHFQKTILDSFFIEGQLNVQRSSEYNGYLNKLSVTITARAKSN